MPYPKTWGHAIWVEIDQDKQAKALISGAAIWEKCELEGQGRRCMPFVEAAHIGDMPASSIRAAYYIAEGFRDWQSINAEVTPL